MAIQNEELRTTLTVDVSQHSAGLKRASDDVETYGKKAKSAGESAKSAIGEELDGALRKSGRAGSAVADTIGAIGGRLALVAGGAAVAGVAIYKAFKYVSKASQEAVDLHNNIYALARIPASGGAFRSIAEMDGHLSTVSTKLDELISKRGSIPLLPGGAGIRETVGTFAAFGRTPGQENEVRIAELLRQERKDASDIAENRKIQSEIEKELINGSERGADLDQAHLDTLRAQAQIYEQLNKPGLEEQLNTALDAESQHYQNQLRALNHKHDLIEAQIEFEDELANIHNRDLGTDRERLTILEARVQEASKLEANALSEEEQGAARNRTELAGNALRDEQRRQAIERRKHPREVFERELQERRDREQADYDLSGGAHLDLSGKPIVSESYRRNPQARVDPNTPLVPDQNMESTDKLLDTILKEIQGLTKQLVAQ